MSEIRLNILNGNWTVIAPKRGLKPEKFKIKEHLDIRTLEAHDKHCPFCLDNETQSTMSILPEDRSPQAVWQPRLIDNKYKIFDDFASCPVEPEKFSTHGVHSYYQGCGNHYLVIEHPTHNKIMGAMTKDEIAAVFSRYFNAVNLLKNNPNNLISLIFKNQGVSAGASQPHAHSQIVGSRVVPAWIRNALHVQERYFDEHGICAMCAILDFEIQYKNRILAETKYSVILSPFVAGTPYEIWVVPKRHFACYSRVSEAEIADISANVLTVLQLYADKLGNPDFNYFFHSSPNPFTDVPFYHMFVQILPRLWNDGGFEMGTRISVNPITPESVVSRLST